MIFLNEIGNDWLEYFGFLVLQNTFFLGILTLILYIIKNASARVKHFVTTIGLLKLLIPAFIPTLIFGNAILMPRNIEIVNRIPTGTVINTNVLNIGTLLFIGWITLGVGFILFFLFSNIKLRINLRNSKELKMNEFKALNALKIRLFQSGKISMPISSGYFSKKIYVPIIWDEWNLECQNFIIEHEIAHLKRHDNWILILQMLTKAIYLFHPLVWYLNRQLDDFREMSCDDHTTTGDQTYPIKYSRYLVEIAETSLQKKSVFLPVSAIIKQKNELLNRIKYLMNGKMKTISKPKMTMVIVGLLVCALTFSMYSNNRVHKQSEKGENSAKIYALNESYEVVRNGARLNLAYDTKRDSFIGTIENITDKTLERVQVDVHLSNGTDLGPTTFTNLSPGEKKDIELMTTSKNFEGWIAHPHDERSGVHSQKGEVKK